MRPLKGDRKVDTWFEHYINLDQIDWRLVNTFVNEDFDLTQPDHDHWSATNWYIFSEVLGQYFSKLMYKQKIIQGVLIYWKWKTFLPNIRYRNEVTDILQLPALSYKKSSIANTIKIVWEIVK